MSKAKQLEDARQAATKATPARDRLMKLFDADTFTELDALAKVGGEGAGVITGYGCVDGNPVYAFSQDTTVMGAPVGRIHAGKIKKVYELAQKTGAPVVGIYDSNGAKLDEGNDALAAYGEILACANNISGVVPQIALVLGVCAGTSAMMAAGADFVVMSENAEFFMTPPFVAKAKGEEIGDAGTAAAAARAGVAHLVEEDEAKAIESTRRLLGMLPSNNLSSVPHFDFSAPDGAVLAAAGENIAAADQKAVVNAVFDADSTLELQKKFASNVYAGLGTLAGFTVGFVSVTGDLCAGGCAKAARLMSVCDAFQLPVVTFVNCEGFKQSAKAELSGAVREMAKLAHVYAEATTPKVSVITGAAYGAAYIALAGKGANADIALAWPGAVISGMQPEAAVALLHGKEITAEKSREQVVAEYKDTTASAFTAAADGIVEDVIAPADTRAALIASLEMLAGKRVTRLPKKHSNMPL